MSQKNWSSCCCAKNVSNILEISMQLPLEKHNCQLITDELAALCDAELVIFILVEETEKKETIKAISGVKEDIPELREIVQFELRKNKKGFIKNNMDSEDISSLIKNINSCRVELNTVSEETLTAFKKRFSLEKIYVFDVVCGEKITASYFLCSSKEKDISEVELETAKLFIKKIMINYLRAQLEKRLRGNQEMHEYVGKESLVDIMMVIDSLPDATFIIDVKGKVLAWNKAMEKMTGVSGKEIVGKGNYEYALPFYGERRPVLADILLSSGLDIVELERKYDYIQWVGSTVFSEVYSSRVNNGSGAYLWVSASGLYDADEKLVGAIESIRDITEYKMVNRKAVEQKAHFESLFTYTNDAIVYFDNQYKIFNINKQFTDMFGYNLEEVRGQNVNKVVDPQGKSSEYVSPKIIKGEIKEMEAVRYTKTGKAIHVLLKGAPVYVDGTIIGGYVIFTDITERKRYEKQLKYLSLHDKLTGLKNRTFFEEEVKRLSGSREYPITIISIDVDNLKYVNDNMGHVTGDKLLKICAQVLRKSLRKADVVARIGGDEFVVLLPRTEETAAQKIVARINSNINRQNKLSPDLSLSLSIGMATAYKESESLEETFKRADDLMFTEKLSKN